MNGVSKAYCMTGWRIGYAGGPEPLIKAMAMIQSQSTSNPAAVSQWAAVEALDGPQDFIAEAQQDLQGAARPLRLDAQPGERASSVRSRKARSMSIRPARGTIGKTAPTGKKLATDEDFVTELLEAEGVAVVQGTPFGVRPGVPDFVRDGDHGARGSLHAHPALLRQFAIARFRPRRRHSRKTRQTPFAISPTIVKDAHGAGG